MDSKFDLEKTYIVKRNILSLYRDDLEFNGGMIIENIVAQTLICADNELYFFSKSSKDSDE